MIIGVGQNRAFQSYQKAIKLGLNNFEIFAELGYLLTKTKITHKDALFCFERALALDPAQEDLWIQYGDFVRSLGNLKKAMHCYQHALKYIKGEVKHKEVSDTLERVR